MYKVTIMDMSQVNRTLLMRLTLSASMHVITSNNKPICEVFKPLTVECMAFLLVSSSVMHAQVLTISESWTSYFSFHKTI